MTYTIKTSYPKEEALEANKLTERTFNEYLDDIEKPEVISQYNQLLTQGYSIGVSFIPPKINKEGVEDDPFKIAESFELAGIGYKATLKLKASGTYEDMLKVAKMIEREGYDYDINVKLNINENSPVDFEKESSWFDPEYAKYTVTPKASSQDIADLRSLFDMLSEEHYDVSINLKAKVKKDDDDSFASQLEAYPSGTQIMFKLTDASE